ncbi:AAA family ATPase [Hymenobacter defluvii]|uniref:AAA family ATPase n=1 Tax=Hymenobacter defluvii TaxID=2054411 RepID=A0ABS3TH41_9BACT|nr:ATP-binding protein [Hymenobacter defluvii]MBO3272974.1 AAA family ATPase [Hymenobacter defluvii]
MRILILNDTQNDSKTIVMYTELLKIIEGGLNKDPRKVANYARLLAENLSKDGEAKTAERILKVLQSNQAQPVYLDQVFTPPVDQETRLNIADLIMPAATDEVQFIFSDTMRSKLDAFIGRLQFRNQLHAAGVDLAASLLLYGPPGCGKTSLAYYISQQTKLPLVVARLDSIVSSLLGNTSKNIRRVFEFASRQPCILFLDEFDAIAKARDDQHELGELKRVVNSLLQNIDEFIQANQSNILIAATNHQELLDRAIWRRFNSIIEVAKPGSQEIKALLSLYLQKGNVDFEQQSKKWDTLVDLLHGCSPADIKAICQNTVAQSIMSQRKAVTHADVLLQFYHFKHHNASSAKALVEFLSQHDVAQKTISDLVDISLRQVQNYLNSNN